MAAQDTEGWEAPPAPAESFERPGPAPFFAPGSRPGEIVKGALLEVPATIATGALAAPVGGLLGAGRAAYEVGLRRKPLGEALEKGGETARSIQEKMTYEPTTAVGQMVPQILAAPFEMASKGLGALAEVGAGPEGRPAARTVAEAAPAAAATLLGVRGMRGRATGPAQLTQPQEAIAEAQRAGFRGLPSEINPSLTNVALESFAKQGPLVKQLVTRNQEQAANLVKQDFGLPPTARLDDAALQSIRARAQTQYAYVKSLPDRIDVRRVDPTFDNKVQNLTRDFAALQQYLPQMYRANTLRRLQADMGRINNITPEGIIDLTKTLRDMATRTLKNPGASDEAVNAAYAFKRASNTLEDVLATHLQQRGMPQMYEAFTKARRDIAKTHTVEETTNLVTGMPDPQKLRRAMERGEPLDGGMRTVARAASAMPNVVRSAEGLMSPEGLILSDYAMGVGIPAAFAAGKPEVAAGLAASMAARPPLRAALASGPYQRAMATPRGTVPRAPMGPVRAGQAATGAVGVQAPYRMSEQPLFEE